MGWTRTATDTQHGYSLVAHAAGVTPPAVPGALSSCGSAGNQLTCAANNTTTTLDEAGVSRTNTVNGLGQLIQVVENGICQAPTSYGYDVLGNLTSVSHGNYQLSCSLPPVINPSRTFVYDSLSRLQTATNAEASPTTYTYDNDSNLKTRTDGQGRTATFTYDNLNHLTGKSYSDSTPAVTYSYVNNVQDFLSSVTSSASSYTYSNYDALGRPGAGTQTTPQNGQPYSFLSVLWTPQGQIASITYPSGRVITTTFDGAGRSNTVAGTVPGGSSTAYAGGTISNCNGTPNYTGICYAAHGAPSALPLGNGLLQTFTFNGQLQMASVAAGSLMTLQFGYSPTQNNGNLLSQTITRGSFTATQNYGYDGVNRLTSASEGSTWSQTYVYDNVGNRAVLNSSSILASDDTPQTGNTTSVPYTANRWTLGGYDGSGNMTTGNTQSVRPKTLTYDAEERLTQWTIANPAATASFTYDGDGRRVTKTVGTQTTVYVYDPIGNLAAEYGGAPSSVAGTVYLTLDHLGSTRLVTNAANGQPQVVGCHDYLPFGEEISWGRSGAQCYSQAADTSIKFTGQERDAETGLDNFLARNMAGPQGRFLSVDPDNVGADPSDPQSWNGYGYVGNNPLLWIDPTGLEPCPPSGNINGDPCTYIPPSPPPDIVPWWDCRSLLNSIFCGMLPPTLSGLIIPPPPPRACVETALRAVIAKGEGTDKDPNNGYGRVVRGKVIAAPSAFSNLIGTTNAQVANPSSLTGHPNILVQVSPGLKSTAFGRYQINTAAANEFNITDFSPAGQDRAANDIMNSQGMIQSALKGNIAQAILRGNGRWASLPKSPYGQPTLSMNQALVAYSQTVIKCQ